MTNLADFGGGIEQPDDAEDTTDEQTESRYKYSAGRCRAIKKTSGGRCRGSASEGELCYYHDQDDVPVTIDANPIDLIEWTSRTKFENLEDLDVDEDLIRQAVHNISGLPDQALPVYEDGLWLPQRYLEASWLIVRTPTKTAESRKKGSGRRKRICSLARAGDWDPDYLDGEGRTAAIRNEECLPGEGGVPKVGLKIAGEEQRWFPVEIEDGDHDVQ